jgi:glycosyltransferase involved in cell wall biosynthesis
MRLMQVTHSLERGGSETLAKELALRLHDPEARSAVCAVDLGGPLAQELAANGIATFVMGRRPGVDGRLPLRLLRLFLRERPAIVQTHHLTQLVYAGLPARLAGARLVHVEHECFSLAAPRHQRQLRGLSFLCDRVVAVAEEVRAFLLGPAGLRAAKVQLIRNGVDLGRYRAEARRSCQDLGLPAGARLVGTVGRLEPEKDQRTLLAAFPDVLAAHPSTRLVIVGDGSLRASLVETAQSLGIMEHVHFLGARPDVAALLPSLDVFALPSLREGLPLAALEAMACGRPVVTTSVGELGRLVHHGVTGLTVAPGDASALARSIATILADRRLAERLGRAARQAVADQFDLETTVRHYRTLHHSILESESLQPLRAPAP